MELTLWEDISNMRWTKKLLRWRLLLRNSASNWKNNSSLGRRIMENGLCKYGEIWRNMDKFNQKKIAVRTISHFSLVFSPKQEFQKNNRRQFEGIIEHYGSDKRDLKWHIKYVIVLRAKTRFLGKCLKIHEISREKKFMFEKNSRMEILKISKMSEITLGHS